jgi:BASS family bile acid:Na+ symporter
MTLQQAIVLAINVSIVLLVFALGLRSKQEDTLWLFRRPGLLARSILAMNVVMVAVATLAALALDLPRTIEIALVALAISPVPPILPNKQLKAGGEESYAIGLLVAASLIAVVLAPLLVVLVGVVFGQHLDISVRRIATVVLVSVVAPLVVGVLFRRFAPDLAARIARPISIGATVLLAIAVMPVLITSWPTVWALVGNGIILVLVAFSLIGLLVGHLLGGPDPDDRTVLALATSTRHPGVAITLASIAFPDERAVLAVVLWHLIVGAIVCVPYVRWRRRVHRESAP